MKVTLKQETFHHAINIEYIISPLSQTLPKAKISNENILNILKNIYHSNFFNWLHGCNQ